MGETISLDVAFPEVESQIEIEREYLIDELWAEYSHNGLEGKVKDCIGEKVPEEIRNYVDDNYDLDEFVTESDWNERFGNEVQEIVSEWLGDVVRLKPENLCEVGEKFSAAVVKVVKGMNIECKCADNNISADEISDLTLSARDIATFQAIEAEVLNIKSVLRSIRNIIGSEVQI